MPRRCYSSGSRPSRPGREIDHAYEARAWRRSFAGRPRYPVPRDVDIDRLLEADLSRLGGMLTDRLHVLGAPSRVCDPAPRVTCGDFTLVAIIALRILDLIEEADERRRRTSG